MPDRTNKKLWAEISLITVSIMWGGGFIAVKTALSSGLAPGLINFLRSAIAILIMLPFCLFELRRASRREWLSGILAGSFMTFGFILQTIGQKYTTPSNNAFLTTLNVIFVPFIAWFFTKKKPEKRHIFSAFLSLCGIFLLTYSLSEGLCFGAGDMLVVLCAFFFACHIAYLGKISADCNIKFLILVQMMTSAVFSLVYFLLFDESPAAGADMIQGVCSVLYLGVTSCACFFMQTFAQKHIPAAQAAVFLSMEGLFGSLFSVIVGFEPLTVNLVLGGCVIFSAVLLTELSVGRRKPRLSAKSQMTAVDDDKAASQQAHP